MSLLDLEIAIEEDDVEFFHARPAFEHAGLDPHRHHDRDPAIEGDVLAEHAMSLAAILDDLVEGCGHAGDSGGRVLEFTSAMTAAGIVHHLYGLRRVAGFGSLSGYGLYSIV